MDEIWHAQSGAADTALVDEVLGIATAEIFVMCAQSLNVAVSHTTSDYWQGDEAQHQDTYGIGSDAIRYSDIELDESSQRYQGRISVTLIDPDAGNVDAVATDLAP